MNKYFFIRLFLCFFICGIFLHNYINQQNQVTKRRLEIPLLSATLRCLEEENIFLQFLIDKIESPDHLMEIANLPEYSYLIYPKEGSIIYNET